MKRNVSEWQLSIESWDGCLDMKSWCVVSDTLTVFLQPI